MFELSEVIAYISLGIVNVGGCTNFTIDTFYWKIISFYGRGIRTFELGISHLRSHMLLPLQNLSIRPTSAQCLNYSYCLKKQIRISIIMLETKFWDTSSLA